MKQRTIWIIGGLFLTISLSSYQHFRPNKTIQNQDNKTFNTLIKTGWVGDFQLGAKLVAPNTQYQIAEHVKTYPPEKNLATEKRYFATMGADTLLELYPDYDFEKEAYGNTIMGISTTSPVFQTAQKVGVGSTLGEFAKAYPDYNIYYSIYTYFYVATSECDLYFTLDPNDGPGVPQSSTEVTKLDRSSFNSESKIIEILLDDRFD